MRETCSRDDDPTQHDRCACRAPDRMRETPDDAARCAYCGGMIRRAIISPFVRRALSRELPAKVLA